MFGFLCRLWFKYIMRWKLSGPHPNVVKKKIIIVVPHTSGWDLSTGLVAKYGMGLNVKFVGKKSLFKGPKKYFFYMLGLLPIDRSKGKSAVDEIIKLFNSKEELTIGMAPEGTRKKVTKLKSGFYRIAKALDIPVIMVKFDYANKMISFSPPYFLTKTKLEDMAYIENYFRGVIGKVPEYSF